MFESFVFSCRDLFWNGSQRNVSKNNLIKRRANRGGSPPKMSDTLSKLFETLRKLLKLFKKILEAFRKLLEAFRKLLKLFENFCNFKNERSIKISNKIPSIPWPQSRIQPYPTSHTIPPQPRANNFIKLLYPLI